MIAEALVRLVAPLLSFTADEIWHYMPQISNRLPSVHLELFPKPESLAATIDAEFMSDWASLLSVRDEALKSLEEARKAKLIGKALDARLVLEVPDAMGALLARYQGSLKELLNVSQVEVVDRAVGRKSSRLRCRPRARNASVAGTTPCTWVRIGGGRRFVNGVRRRSIRWVFLRKKARLRMTIRDSRGWLLLLSLIVVVADRVTKWLAATRIELGDQRGGDPSRVSPSVMWKIPARLSACSTIRVLRPECAGCCCCFPCWRRLLFWWLC